MKLPIKILYIISDLSRGGAQSVLFNLIANLTPHKFNVTVISLGENMIMAPDFERINCKVILFKNENLKAQYFQFRELIIKISPDVAHTHIAFYSSLLFIFLRLSGVKKIINTIHRFDPSMPLHKKINESLTPYLIDYQINISHFSEKLYQKYFGLPLKKAKIIPNGIDLTRFTVKGDRYNYGEGFHIVSVANLHLKKGYESAVQAIKILVEEFPKINYHIIGANVPGNGVSEWIEKYINDTGIGQYIHIHGMKNDVRPYLRSADLFLTPSEQEILPMSILEAMACGCPVLATNIGAISEILPENFHHQQLISHSDPLCISNAIRKVLNQNSILTDWKDQALKKILHFSATTVAQQYEDIY